MPIVKIINSIYQEFLKNVNKSNSITLTLLVYELYQQKFGVKTLSEKKTLDFYIQLRRTEDNQRVNMFLKFIGLDDISCKKFNKKQTNVKKTQAAAPGNGGSSSSNNNNQNSYSYSQNRISNKNSNSKNFISSLYDINIMNPSIKNIDDNEEDEEEKTL